MGGIVKSIGKLVGIDYDGANKASQQEAAAITNQANMQAMDNAYAAQSAAQQMQVEATTKAQQADANALLSTPVKNASVDLASTANGADDTADDNDILMKRKSARSAYQANSSQSGLVV